MKKALFPLALSILFSCNRESKFDVEKDLYQFSEKMENGDTLEVYVNLSACMFAASERYNFLKENDTLYLETHSEISSFEKKQQTLPKIIYPFKPNNSFSFENYFKYLKNENKAKRKYGSSLVTVYYPNKDQTQYFNDDGLGDKFTKLDKLSLIRKRLYPNDKFFETPEPPPPPPSRK
ncbi:hypothetical protein [Chryseobacterium sp. 18068]|uniref:hypothetical protein n=1 Tax=Chryseobacterium sp. 18068 TaxID=2681414 RepID=UPI001359F21E|nr:hypothetical protein [Chryseobacterium sp. 18068]